MVRILWRFRGTDSIETNLKYNDVIIVRQCDFGKTLYFSHSQKRLWWPNFGDKIGNRHQLTLNWLGWYWWLYHEMVLVRFNCQNFKEIKEILWTYHFTFLFPQKNWGDICVSHSKIEQQVPCYFDTSALIISFSPLARLITW